MSSIIIVNGSPHAGGVADYLAGEISGRLKNIPSASLLEITLRNNAFSFCKGCNTCDTSGVCVIKDDLGPLMDKFHNFDACIVVFPLYFMGPPAMLKSFIDRFQLLYVQYKQDPTRFTGRRKVFLLGYGGLAGLTDPLSSSRRIFKAVCLSMGATLSADRFIEKAENRRSMENRADALTAINGLVIDITNSLIG